MSRLSVLGSVVLYTALSFSANPVAAASLAALKQGDMAGLVVYDQPLATPDFAFTDTAGAEHRLADYRGKVLVVNFWATWCAPCRREMTTLDALQAARGGDDFAVLPIATGRNPEGQIRRFFKETQVTQLPILQDEQQKLARAMGVIGLPVSVVIDKRGHEVARLIGEADWNGPAARAVIDAVLKQDTVR